ncbi:MAG: D-glycero-beta-D-manno-heptose 1,7-bisphosphate 7-phosphatase [Candidatus Methylophosphatis roskildensis]
MTAFRALFLDRDGIINLDHGYVHRKENFEFLPGIFDLGRAARSLDLRIIVVTNQAGIGRGLFTEREFAELTEWMNRRFADENAPIFDVYHCSAHPEHGIGEYQVDSHDRKPNPGMFLRAQRDHGIDLEKSIMIGDKASDLVAAFSAGVETRILLRSTHHPGESTEHATHVVCSLEEAISILSSALIEECTRDQVPAAYSTVPNLDQCRVVLESAGYLVRKPVFPSSTIVDQNLYAPYINNWATFQPWIGSEFIEGLVTTLLAAGRLTLVTRDRLWVLKTAFEQTRNLSGEIWETGVFQGGTALMLKRLLEVTLTSAHQAELRLFDTFQGMPETRDDLDLHREGDFADTSLEAVRSLIGPKDWIHFHPGRVPETFAGLEARLIRLAHVDLDIYEGILSTCEFVYPRLVPGGMMVFDDYGFWSCPGARMAVDQFFAGTPEQPLALPTGQAIVTKLPVSAPFAASTLEVSPDSVART